MKLVGFFFFRTLRNAKNLLTEDDQLRDITYIFNVSYSQNTYTEMLKNLTNKYGTPIFNENSPFPSESCRIFSQNDTTTNITVECSTLQYSGWMVKYSDCYVEIDLCLHKMEFGTTYNITSIGYRLVSYQEFDALQNLIQEHTQSVQDSIDNDL